MSGEEDAKRVKALAAVVGNLTHEWQVVGLAIAGTRTKPEMRALLRIEARNAIDRMLEMVPEEWTDGEDANGLRFELTVRPVRL